MNQPRHGHTDRGGGGALVIGCAAFAVLLLSMSLAGAYLFLRTGPSSIPPIVLTPPPAAPSASPVPVPAAPALPVPLEAAPEPLPADDEGTIGLESAGTIERERAPDEPARASGRVGAGSHEVHGTLAPAVIQSVVRRHMNEVRYCYERALVEAPTLSGQLTVSFVIAPDGRVSVASAGESTFPGSPATTMMTACILSAARRWVFPTPEGGGIVRVEYPFVLSPG